MNLRFQFDTEAIHWETVVAILKASEMAHYTSAIHQKEIGRASCRERV